MDTKTITNYLQEQITIKRKSLQYMDRRHRIPRRISNEIKKLKDMIDFLNINEK